MDAETTTLLATIGGAAVASLLSAYLTLRIRRARPICLVSGIELSSTMLTRVDHLSLPEEIFAHYTSFPYSAGDGNAATQSPLRSIGELQESLYIVTEFVSRLGHTFELLDRLIEQTTNRPTNASLRAQLRGTLVSCMQDKIILDHVVHSTRRGTLSCLARPCPAVDEDKLQFPWSRDDASGPGRGTLGCYSIHIGSARALFPFHWEDEESRMRHVSFAIASCDYTGLNSIATDIRNMLKDEQAVALQIKSWLGANLAPNSTLCIELCISNLGFEPVLLDTRATLRLCHTNREESRIECVGENFQGDQENESAVSRTIKIFHEIGRSFDVTIPIQTRVPLNRVMIKPGGATKVTFRSSVRLRELPRGQKVLNTFDEGDREAQMELVFFYASGKRRKQATAPFQFRSGILRPHVNQPE